MIARRGLLATVAALAGLAAAAGPLTAQACQGLPLAGGERSVSVLLGFPRQADHRVGAAADYALGEAARTVVSASYARTRGGDEGSPGTRALGLRVARDVSERLGQRRPPALSLCPSAGARHERYGEVRTVTLPAGVALGWAVPVREGLTATPFLEPRVVYTRSRLAGVTRSAYSSGIRGGVSLLYRDAFVGVGYERVRARAANREISLRAGVRLRAGTERAADGPGRSERVDHP